MATVTEEFVEVGGLRIPATNIDEWDALNEQIHELIVAAKPIPDELRRRSYILEGATEDEADLLMRGPAYGDAFDTHEVE
jgi:hypothetical protein